LVNRVRNSRGGIAAVLALLLGIGLSTPIQAQDTTGSRAAEKSAPGQAHSPTTAGGGYYIEFRAAQIGAYGHSYVAYGNVGGRQNFADLHPMGNYAVMALGHVLPVPANTQWDPDVLKLPVTSRYRRSLNAEQYRKLLAAVSTAKANKSPYWNAVTNNCNHFIGELAQAIGLKVPGQFQVSYAFVPALKELNEGAVGGTRKVSGEHRAVATPRS
jgi:hypothetical protein